jgi:hypothetical protein
MIRIRVYAVVFGVRADELNEQTAKCIRYVKITPGTEPNFDVALISRITAGTRILPIAGVPESHFRFLAGKSRACPSSV